MQSKFFYSRYRVQWVRFFAPNVGTVLAARRPLSRQAVVNSTPNTSPGPYKTSASASASAFETAIWHPSGQFISRVERFYVKRDLTG